VTRWDGGAPTAKVDSMNPTTRAHLARRAARRAATRRVLTARRAATALAVASAVLVPATGASAEQVPVLVGEHGTHSIWVSESEPYDVPTDQQNSYWGFVPLDGMCGMAGTRLVLSDMREVFFVQEKTRGAQAGTSTGIGKILDETFVLTQYDAAGAEVRTFTGTGDEYAQFTQATDGSQQVNLRVMFRGDSPDGHRLSFSLKLRVRPAQDRFEAAVDSCHTQ
jgi:hypothetical protein